MRRALPPSAVALRSAKIVERLLALECVQRARAVASFWPISGEAEVDLRALDTELARRGIERYFPFMDPTEGGHVTGFRRIEHTGELSSQGKQFMEPPRAAPRAERGSVDVVLVPALAVTIDGHRLGYGSGFYDATLPDVCPPALCVAVAYSFQLIAELPVEPHDVACDLVVTDREALDPKGLLPTPQT